jgi:plastocyanin
MHRRLLLALFALLALSIAAVGCGGDDDDDSGGNGDGVTTAATTPAEDDGDDDGDNGGGQTSFDVTLTDNVFDPAEFTVPAGEDITVNLQNDGTAIHNMRIAGADGEYNSDDDAVSDLIVAAGAASVVEWETPDEPGEYPFQCDYHLPDMAGTITVE